MICGNLQKSNLHLSHHWQEEDGRKIVGIYRLVGELVSNINVFVNFLTRLRRISCAMGGISIDKLVSDDGLRKLADKVMDETISIANADLISRNVDNAMLLGDAEVTHFFIFCVLN